MPSVDLNPSPECVDIVLVGWEDTDLTQHPPSSWPAAPLTQYQLSVLTATSHCNTELYGVLRFCIEIVLRHTETWNLIKCNLCGGGWLWLAHLAVTDGNFKSHSADTDGLSPQFSQLCGKLLINNSNEKLRSSQHLFPRHDIYNC